MSYTHVVFTIGGGKKILKTPLADVGIALYQIRDFLSDREGALTLLWVLEFLRQPVAKRSRIKSVEYFFNYKRRPLFDLLSENSLIEGDTEKGFKLDPVFENCLLQIEAQRGLYFKLFEALSKDAEVVVEEPVESEDDSEETVNMVSYSRLEMLTKSIEISFDYYNATNGTYTNIDQAPEKTLIKIFGGEENYRYLKGLLW